MRVKFIIDEAGSLGSLSTLETLINVGRGYGVDGVLIYQNVGQLRKCFPEGQHQTILGSSGQIFFGTNDNETAETISNRIGDATITLVEHSTNTSSQHGHSSGRDSSTNSSWSHSTNKNFRQMARRLLQPSEVMALSPRTAITFLPGMPPIQTQLIRFYEEKWLTKGEGFGAKFRAAFRLSCSLALCGGLLWVAAKLTSQLIVALNLWSGK